MLGVLFTVLILLSNVLLLFLLCTLHFSETDMSESDDHEAAVTDDETNHVDESASKAESKSNERFLIKIMYEETEAVKQWFVPIISGIVDIDMDELRKRITNLFGLPHNSKLDVRYYDEHGSLVTIADNNHLEDILLQKMDHLKIYVRIINNAAATTLVGGGGGARVQPVCTSKPTNTSNSRRPPEFDMDDWLIT